MLDYEIYAYDYEYTIEYTSEAFVFIHFVL